MRVRNSLTTVVRKGLVAPARGPHCGARRSSGRSPGGSRGGGRSGQANRTEAGHSSREGPDDVSLTMTTAAVAL